MTETADRMVRMSPELMAEWATRDADGYRLSWDWGEPDADGFYTPVITKHYDDRIGELDAAWAAALAAFPDGWGGVNIWPPFPGDPWVVQVTKQVRFGRGGASRYNRLRGEGSDLAAAFRDLAAKLQS